MYNGLERFQILDISVLAIRQKEQVALEMRFRSSWCINHQCAGRRLCASCKCIIIDLNNKRMNNQRKPEQENQQNCLLIIEQKMYFV